MKFARSKIFRVFFPFFNSFTRFVLFSLKLSLSEILTSRQKASEFLAYVMGIEKHRYFSTMIQKQWRKESSTVFHNLSLIFLPYFFGFRKHPTYQLIFMSTNHKNNLYPIASWLCDVRARAAIILTNNNIACTHYFLCCYLLFPSPQDFQSTNQCSSTFWQCATCKIFIHSNKIRIRIFFRTRTKFTNSGLFLFQNPVILFTKSLSIVPFTGCFLGSLYATRKFANGSG